MVRTLFVSLLFLSVTAFATWGNWLPGINLNWGSWGGNQYPQKTWAWEGQYCSYYPGYGPQCAPGLYCANRGFNNMGFGVCYAYRDGWDNGGGWNGGGHPGNHHEGCGCHH